MKTKPIKNNEIGPSGNNSSTEKKEKKIRKFFQYCVPSPSFLCSFVCFSVLKKKKEIGPSANNSSNKRNHYNCLFLSSFFCWHKIKRAGKKTQALSSFYFGCHHQKKITALLSPKKNKIIG